MVAGEDVGWKVRTGHVPYVPIAAGVGPGYEDPDVFPHDGVFSSFEVEGILSHAVGKGKWCALDNMPELVYTCLRYESPLQQGDVVVFYIGKKRAGRGGPGASVSQFGPVAKVTGEEFASDTPIWASKGNDLFRSRLPISIMSEGRVDAAIVIPHLDFVQNKDKWGLYFLTGIRKVSEEDYKTLLAAIKK